VIKQQPDVKINLVNSNIGDYQRYLSRIKLHEDFKHLDVSTTKKGKEVFILEDIITMKECDAEKLRVSLNLWAHHFLLKFFFISHAITKTCLYSMLNFFRYIIFMPEAASKYAVEQVLLVFCKDKQTRAKMLKQVDNIHSQIHTRELYSCFYYDVGKHELFFTTNVFEPDKSLRIGSNSDILLSPSNHLAPPRPAPSLSRCLHSSLKKRGKGTVMVKRNGGRKSGDTSNIGRPSFNSPTGGGGSTSGSTVNSIIFLSEKFSKFISGFEKAQTAKSIFSIIINSINTDYVRKNDLTFNFATQSAQKEENVLNLNLTVPVSLVDYITTLLTPTSVADIKSPPVELLVLHQYLNSLCKIPAFYIENKFFKS
jgi:hypothetical protein